jgi:hypothetical protein
MIDVKHRGEHGLALKVALEGMHAYWVSVRRCRPVDLVTVNPGQGSRKGRGEDPGKGDSEMRLHEKHQAV